MTLIDGDKIVTAQLYDDEHEEFIDKKMSIIDFVNAYSDEGVTTADDVLENIKAEIRQQQWHLGVDNTNQVIEIIDKHINHKAENEDIE
jgi:hypothetical protein